MEDKRDETRTTEATGACGKHHAIARRHGGPRGGVIRLLSFGLLLGALGFFAGRAMAHDGGSGGRFCHSLSGTPVAS